MNLGTVEQFLENIAMIVGVEISHICHRKNIEPSSGMDIFTLYHSDF